MDPRIDIFASPVLIYPMKTLRHVTCSILTLALFAAAMPALAKPQLHVGDKAPLVSGHDQDGNKWKLKDDLGRNIVLLYFYPKDSTPGCTTEACSLRDKLSEFKEKGVKVIGVSFDNADSHKRFIFKYNINFPLLVDTDGKIADAYGARMGKDRKLDRRISFLIGLDGRIVQIVDNPSPEVHLHDMQAAIDRLQGKSPL